MSDTYNLPNCSCCFRKISPNDIGAIKFRCPSCGDVVQVRCSRCRNIENKYICPACGFEGP